MPRPRWIAVLIALIAVVWVLRSTVFRAPPVAVEVAIAGRGIVLDTVSNSRAATVRSRLRARVGAETGGRVVALPQRAGMRVTAGDVLVELDAATARRRLALAREDLAAARARFEAADAAAALAASERSRVESLGNAGLVATEQLDTARSAADRTRAEAAAARAQIERAAAAVRLTEQEIENLRVRAPFDGVVAEVLTELGESVVPGAPLIEILDPDALYVSAEIDEVDIGRVQVGLAVLIELDPFPGVEFHGTVTRVAPYVSDLLEQNRTLEVEIDFETPAELPDPRPGTSADVEIILERRDDVMRVPTFSVIEGDHVLVVEAGRARARRVTTGLRNWDFTEIVDGLRGGERVITSLDRVQLEPGMRVEAEGSTGTDRGQ